MDNLNTININSNTMSLTESERSVLYCYCRALLPLDYYILYKNNPNTLRYELEQLSDKEITPEFLNEDYKSIPEDLSKVSLYWFNKALNLIDKTPEFYSNNQIMLIEYLIDLLNNDISYIDHNILDNLIEDRITFHVNFNKGVFLAIEYLSYDNFHDEYNKLINLFEDNTKVKLPLVYSLLYTSKEYNSFNSLHLNDTIIYFHENPYSPLRNYIYDYFKSNYSNDVYNANHICDIWNIIRSVVNSLPLVWDEDYLLYSLSRSIVLINKGIEYIKKIINAKLNILRITHLKDEDIIYLLNVALLEHYVIYNQGVYNENMILIGFMIKDTNNVAFNYKDKTYLTELDYLINISSPTEEYTNYLTNLYNKGTKVLDTLNTLDDKKEILPIYPKIIPVIEKDTDNIISCQLVYEKSIFNQYRNNWRLSNTIEY